MSYKTILVVLSETADAAPLLKSVLPFARAQQAHLEVLCLGIDRTQTGYYFAGASIIVHDATWAAAETEAKKMEAEARAVLEPSDVQWRIESIVAQISGAQDMTERRARYADLVVIPTPYGPSRAFDAPAMLETALFRGHVPTLVMPDSSKLAASPKRLVLAWNQSDEAMVAVRQSLAVLQGAEVVDICMIAPTHHSSDTADPGSELCQMLVRHGVKAQVTILAQTLPRVSDVLSRRLLDFDADLLVMGAYGHSRFRQAILGGATRDMLETAQVPVLMAH